MSNGKKTIIAVLLVTALVEAFFIVNNPDFKVQAFLGVPYNPFVIYFYLTILSAIGVFTLGGK